MYRRFSSRQSIHVLAVLLIGAVVTSDSSTAFADGFIRDSMGARTAGRGGANLGYADNGAMLLDNPAAMINMDSMRMTDFGIDLLLTDLSWSDPDNPRTGAEDNPIPTGQFSYAMKTANPNVAVGIGLFSQAGFGAEYTLEGRAPFSGPQHYKSFGAMARFLPAISVRMTDRLSVGANLGVAINHMELEGPYTLQGPNAFAGTPTKFDLQATGAGLSWASGLQYRLSNRTTIGVNYQDQVKMTLDGNTVVEIPGLGQSRFDTKLDVKWPRSLGVGLKHQLRSDLDFGLDVVWFNWSDAFQSFDNHLSNPDNPVYAAVVGDQLQENLPLNWRDTVSVRTGLQKHLCGGKTLRVGYTYHRNPIPDGTLSPFVQTNLEHAFALGYGWKALGHELDFAYQFSFSDPQQTGTSDYLGGDFDNATAKVQAHWLSLSAIRRF
ncbi:OmpP1/FadL family transporter [Mariniblastus fucicola]|uniref:Outer membrane protein transport protein (OMPP1/FadL/TodX) n=1 Tax=Mariniblastus fucicola TaxID=980251 RepID=A0A5B9PAJ2_9BACT|nr:outer membrane protein transport protein [Mariniblastus fucicola]QEG22509.1 Outer membrane protein transport protein (OMPP1/FadL/TodX) [Mariniblastus fucicola]